MLDYDAFNAAIDAEAIMQKVHDICKNEKFRDVPSGTYIIKILSMELSTSRSGKPMCKMRFRITEGEHQGRYIFYNQVVEQVFQININNEFLRSLKAGDVEFVDYNQYSHRIQDMRNTIAAESLTYELCYGKNDKGYSTYKIVAVHKG